MIGVPNVWERKVLGSKDFMRFYGHSVNFVAPVPPKFITEGCLFNKKHIPLSMIEPHKLTLYPTNVLTFYLS